MKIGFLHKVKGHEILIEAAKILFNKKYKNVKIYIIGDGPEYNKIMKKIKNYNLDEHVILIGAIDHQQIPQWINLANFFVMPSLNEGMPTALLEALSCGKPFIGSNVGGISEIINSDNIGLLVPPGDPNKLANALETAILKTWDYQLISSHVRKYSWQNISKKIIETYQS